MKNGRVFVTGANGHLGLVLCQLLHDRGYAVHAGVRGASDLNRFPYLRDLGIPLVEVDVLNLAQLDAAIAGMDAVIHTAAVHALSANDPSTAVYRPIVDGTLNVARASRRHGVRRLVITSSAAAVGTCLPGEPARDESGWNQTTSDTYLRAKAEAEKLAWEYAADQGLDMVSILPAAMIGPGFHRHTPTTRMLNAILQGKLPCRLPLNVNVVDVRDVAQAHVMVLGNERAKGRYLCTNWSGTLEEIIRLLKSVLPTVHLPRCAVPQALMPLLAAADALRSRITALPRLLTRELIEDYGLRAPLFNSGRLMNELGWRPRSVEQSLRDTIAWLHDVFPHEAGTNLPRMDKEGTTA